MLVFSHTKFQKVRKKRKRKEKGSTRKGSVFSVANASRLFGCQRLRTAGVLKAPGSINKKET
jgi:hypothetical protein